VKLPVHKTGRSGVPARQVAARIQEAWQASDTGCGAGWSESFRRMPAGRVPGLRKHHI